MRSDCNYWMLYILKLQCGQVELIQEDCDGWSCQDYCKDDALQCIADISANGLHIMISLSQSQTQVGSSIPHRTFSKSCLKKYPSYTALLWCLVDHFFVCTLILRWKVLQTNFVSLDICGHTPRYSIIIILNFPQSKKFFLIRLYNMEFYYFRHLQFEIVKWELYIRILYKDVYCSLCTMFK